MMKTIYSPVKFLLFGLVIFLLGCEKGGGNNGGGSTNATYYYKATIGGVNYLQEVTPTNGYASRSAAVGGDDVALSASIDLKSNSTPVNLTSLKITKGILHKYLTSTNAQFNAFFIPGNYHYTTGPEFDPFQNADGVYISWVDKQGNLWTTIDGSGNQTGSSFNIVSAVDSAGAATHYIKAKMEFNCKLYKKGTGEMVQLTNGEMVGLFGKL